MAIQEKKLATYLITASEGTVYSCPASTTAIVKIIWICNTTAAAVTVELWNPQASATGSDTNKLFDTFPIPANDFIQVSTYLILTNNGTADTIRASASSASACSIHLYGAELT